VAIKIVSFNTNGIRARPHQLQMLRSQYDPDIIGIQETKVQDQDFPIGMIEDLGYQPHYFGQKTHYGVALLSKNQPVSVQKGYPTDEEDAQRRLISATYETGNGERLVVINGYFPQGESRDHAVKFPAKQKFYADLMSYLESGFSPDDNLVVIGDMNIAPQDLDIGIGEDNARRWLRTGKCSFLPEEREWLQRLGDWGLIDTYRSLQGDTNGLYSWFDYRSRGFEREPRRGLRIDLILATSRLAAKCIDAGIAYDIRAMEKPSDHCPVWAEFDL
jgi:exodeoxyribonuclease-3